MEILYKCGCCGFVYTRKEDALRCEFLHKSWRNATVEFDEDELSSGCYGSPREIRLRNEEGTSFVYKRMNDSCCTGEGDI